MQDAERCQTWNPGAEMQENQTKRCKYKKIKGKKTLSKSETAREGDRIERERERARENERERESER